MSRQVVVATTAFGSPRPTTKEENLTLAQSVLDAAGRSGADVICLPETFTGTGLTWDGAFDAAESIPGASFDVITTSARSHQMYVIAGVLEQRNGRLFNTAVVVDRNGDIVGRYDKMHPILPEMDRGVIPGQQPMVFSTDFGRVGIAICFDIGWPALWDELGALGAEIVFWPSAYDGGFPLRAYAWRNRYYVISAVGSNRACIIDPAGQELATTTPYVRLLTRTIDLDKELFHVDYQADKLREIPGRFGRSVSLQSLGPEAIFTIEANDPDLSVQDVKRALALETFQDYHRRVEVVQDRVRHEQP